MTDSLPPSVTLVSGSFSPVSEASNVAVSGDSRVFTWTTGVDPGSKSLNFQVTVVESLADGVTIENIAYLDGGLSPDHIPLPATVTISNPPNIYMPIVLRS